MATNETFRDADHVALPVPAGTVSGSPVRVGGLNAVTQTDRANTAVTPTNPDGTINGAYNAGGGNIDGEASCFLKGGHDFTVAFAVAAKGTPVYITGANVLDASASGNSLYGHALSTKGAAAGPLTVRIAN